MATHKNIPIDVKLEIVGALGVNIRKLDFADLLISKQLKDFAVEEVNVIRLRYKTVFNHLFKTYSKEKHQLTKRTDGHELARDLFVKAAELKSAHEMVPINQKLVGIYSHQCIYNKARKSPIKLKIPLTFYSDSEGNFYQLALDGSLKTKTNEISFSALKGFLKNRKHIESSFPGYVLKQEKVGTDHLGTEFFAFSEYKTILKKLVHSLKHTCRVVLQEFLMPRCNLPNKYRVSFSNKIEKVIMLTPKASTEDAERTEDFMALEVFSHLGHLKADDMELLRSKVFSMRNNIPITSNTLLYISEDSKNELFRVYLELSEFIILFAERARKIVTDSSMRITIKKIKKFFLNRRKLYSSMLYEGKPINNRHSVKIGPYSLPGISFSSLKFNELHITEIKSIIKLNTLSDQMKELGKCLSSKFINQHREPVGFTADFIEVEQNLFYLITVVAANTEYKVKNRFPPQKHNRFLSVLTVTESSLVSKYSILCCGDYCGLFDRDDPTIREKIEYLMKNCCEYAGLLNELLKLYDNLNADSFQYIFSPAKDRKQPIPKNNQYKVVRRAILYDRANKQSLKSLLDQIPAVFLNDIGIHSSGHTNKTFAFKNKQISWEFERVPVCDICFEIYKKHRISFSPHKRLKKRTRSSSSLFPGKYNSFPSQTKSLLIPLKY